jgi:DNA invertase Pin-like site-specific DNA recombinase
VKAFGYSRLSKWDDATTSPQRQREAVERLCRDRGWDLVETFSDVESGYNGKRRAGLDSMLSRLVEVDAVVVYRIDRLARSSKDFHRILERFDEAHVQLAATDMQVDATPAGRLVRDIVARLAEFESDQISVRTRAMHEYLRKEGKWQGGPAPFGFAITADKHLIPDPEEAPRLVEAVRRYVGGEALHSIAADLGMHHPGFSRILRYPRTRDILPEDLAEALGRELVDRATRSGPTSPLLSGLARCAVCGAGLQIVTRKKLQGGWGSYGCAAPGHVNISEGWLDAYVSEALMAALDTSKIVAAIKRRQKVKGSPKVVELEARLEVLDDLFAVGEMTERRYRKSRETLVERIDAARQDRRVDAPVLPVEMAENLAERWPELSVGARRKIVSAVLDRVDVAKATGHGKIDPSRVQIVWRT